MASDALRALPSVERLAASLDAPHALAVAAARAVVAERREELRRGDAGPADLVERARAAVEALARPSLRRVLNATGVVVHTNLGRAPLAAAARDAVVAAATGYSNLELDLESGERGSRAAHVRDLLREVTGAEDGFVVNNGAGAVLLAVAALAPGGREVVVSRGQLVEIGGGFRIPEVVAVSGARLVEVGTTNRTRLEDYARAVGPDTAAVLRVHRSNFRQVGFVEDVPVASLCELGVPVIDDVGSGALEPLADEPPVRAAVAAGAALVCFSGDKLLGGPQAGLLVGRADAVARAAAHPLARALRADKLTLAALEATLRLWREPERARTEVPVAAMLAASEEELAARAGALAALVPGASVVRGGGRAGGGALPEVPLEGPVVAVDVPRPEVLAAALRAGDPPVLAVVRDGRLLLDPRTLTDDEAAQAGALVAAALSRLL